MISFVCSIYTDYIETVEFYKYLKEKNSKEYRDNIVTINAYLMLIEERILKNIDSKIRNMPQQTVDKYILKYFLSDPCVQDFFELFALTNYNMNSSLTDIFTYLNFEKQIEIFQFAEIIAEFVFTKTIQIEVNIPSTDNDFKINLSEINQFTSSGLSQLDNDYLYNLIYKVFTMGKAIRCYKFEDLKYLFSYIQINNIENLQVRHSQLTLFYIKNLNEQASKSIGFLQDSKETIDNMERTIHDHYGKIMEITGILIAVFSIIGLAVNNNNLCIQAIIQICLVITFSMSLLSFLIAIISNNGYNYKCSAQNKKILITGREFFLLVASIIAGCILIYYSRYMH